MKIIVTGPIVSEIPTNKKLIKMKVWPGRPFPPGATWDGKGTNFSVLSEVAEWIELCLFDDSGNNNGYCQDNEISWFYWEHVDEALLEFTRRLIDFYKSQLIFSRRRWFQGRAIHGKGVSDIAWFTPDGIEMAEENWRESFAKSMAAFLRRKSIAQPDSRGENIADDSLLLLFNAHHETTSFALPGSQRIPCPDLAGKAIVLSSEDGILAQDHAVFLPGQAVGIMA